MSADRDPGWPRPVRLLVVALAYYVSARLGLQLALVGDVVTPLWPPTGVAIVALAIFGFSVWPAIALAAFAVNLSAADAPSTAAVIAIGNTLAPVAGAALLRRLGFDSQLARLRDAIVLVGVALVSMTVSASVGTAAVSVAGTTSTATIDTWWVWWTGDAMGVLIVAPFLWSLVRVRTGQVRWRGVATASVLFAALAVAADFSSRMEHGPLFVVLPLLGWIAWRFQLAGAAPAGLIASTIVILTATDGAGVFEGEPLLRKMFVLQAFNASVALTSFVFAAAVTERRHILEALYQREHRIAETLQRSLLPEVPSLPGIDLAARYLPSRDESEVAGDWYDVIPLAEDKLGLVVGDVVGHGLAAAAAMAQLRIGLRTYALAHRGPAATVSELNRMAAELYPGTMATLLYAEYDPGRAELRIANAGHPPPLLISANEARYLEAAQAPPIGVSAELECEETVHTIPYDSTLIMFTDGLVERRGRDIDEGLETLRRVSASNGVALEKLCDRITTGLCVEGAGDDVAFLAMRPTSLAGENLSIQRPATAAAVVDVRRILQRWLRANRATDDETFDLLVACSEAQTNAVKHAYRGPDGFVEVEASIDAARVVTLVVRDQGTWRDPAQSSEVGGRGLPIIRALTDVEVRYGEQGTEVRMHLGLTAIR